MIITEDYGFGVGDPKSTLANTRGDKTGGFSHESERDLAMMVSDFWENGSGGNESKYSSDSDSGCSDLGHLADKVSLRKHDVEQCDTDLSSAVRSLLLSINENDLHTFKGDAQCSGGCIRQLLVKHLRISGYDAAVCSSKWQGFDKVPGGDHEYIDVIVNGSTGVFERSIIDIDFRSHFEIARAVKAYDTILSSLPVIYVGSLANLEQFLQIMVDAAKYSLRQHSMPLPPWRSLRYLQAKWQAKYEPNPSKPRLLFFSSLTLVLKSRSLTLDLDLKFHVRSRSRSRCQSSILISISISHARVAGTKLLSTSQ